MSFHVKQKRLCLLVAMVMLTTLTGCAHAPMVSCITPEQLKELQSQEPPRVHDKLVGEADKDIRPITGSNLLLREYSHVLLDALKVCSK